MQSWSVTDVASNRKIATLYVDPYPRDGKYNHAAVWNYRNGASSVPRQAQSALVVNFDRRGLTLRELETLMHEFGHTLRSHLSATRYASDAGENVAQDDVEAPSQMLEDWVYDKKVLKVFQEVCPACKPVPDELVDKARAARDFGKGMQVSRQQLYAAYDLALHGPAAPNPMDAWEKMEARRRWATCRERRFPRASRTSPVPTVPGITVICGAKRLPTTCRRRFWVTGWIRRWGAVPEHCIGRRGAEDATADRQGFPGTGFQYGGVF